MGGKEENCEWRQGGEMGEIGQSSITVIFCFITAI